MPVTENSCLLFSSCHLELVISENSQFLICWFIQQILTPTFSFFLLLLQSFFKLCLQHVTHVTNDKNVTNTMYGCVWVCMGVRVCVCDEFSEYLLETRFLTSANYNPHPLRIFSSSSSFWNKILTTTCRHFQWKCA